MMAGAWEGGTVTWVGALQAGCERGAVQVNDGLLNCVCVCFMSPGDVCGNEGVKLPRSACKLPKHAGSLR